MSAPASPSSATAANRERVAPGPAAGPASFDRPRPVPVPGARAGGEPPGGLPDVRRRWPGVYVGKAKRLRTRLLTYFRASFPTTRRRGFSTRRARSPGIMCPASSPPISGSCGRSGSSAPTSITRPTAPGARCSSRLPEGPAPRVYGGGTVDQDDIRCYGPFRSMARMLEAVRTLNDLLGLRDCAATMPVVFAGQGDLFDQPRQAGCMRHEFGFCSGPCAGLVSQRDYRRRVETAIAFLEGRTIQPIDRVVDRDAGGGRRRPVRGGGALAGEVRAARMAAGGHQPGPDRAWICSPSCTAIPATSATTGSTSCGGAWCGLRFPIRPRRSSTRRSGAWWPRRRPAGAAGGSAAAGFD